MKLADNKFLAGFLALVLAYAAFEAATNWKHYKSYYFSENKVNIEQTSTPGITKPVSNFADIEHLSFKKDPFYPVNHKRTVVHKKGNQIAVKMELKAISKDAANAVVMINETILMEGETIQGYRIEEINRDNVKLSKNGHYEFLYLNTEGR